MERKMAVLQTSYLICMDGPSRLATNYCSFHKSNLCKSMSNRQSILNNLLPIYFSKIPTEFFIIKPKQWAASITFLGRNFYCTKLNRLKVEYIQHLYSMKAYFWNLGLEIHLCKSSTQSTFINSNKRIYHSIKIKIIDGIN